MTTEPKLAANGPKETVGPTRGDLPFAKQLFDAAEGLRGSVESAEYKHLVLGLVFLKYISDSFEIRRAQLDELSRNPESDYFTDDEAERSELIEDRDEYTSENVFWVPEEARWNSMLAKASQVDIGVELDRALESIERENEALRGVLPKVFAKAALSPEKLGDLVSTIGQIGFGKSAEESRDVLGRTYEYFIKEFARSEGHRGGEFYTPRSVTELLVAMLEPYEGRIYDPACGSCGMFIQSAEFIRAHAGRTAELAIYGQEMNQATWRIGQMNLAIHGLAGDIKLGDTLTDDKQPTLKADFVIANPPFNQKKWGAQQVKSDSRWKYGVPPDSNANYAWIQHFISHLAPEGRAGFVLANGSLTASNKTESSIRRMIVEDNVIDCVVALPHQLFFTTAIPVSLWFIDLKRRSDQRHSNGNEILFIDGRSMGELISRTQASLTPDGSQLIASTYHAWRRGTGYEDRAGYCRSVGIDGLAEEGFVLNPGRYVGIPEPPELAIDYPRAITDLSAEVGARLEESAKAAEQVDWALGELKRGI